MRTIKNALYLILFVLLLSCNETINYKEEIIGRWKIDSLLNYDNGEEHMIKVDDDENLFVGSNSNPSFYNFTKYGEAYFNRRNSNTNQNVSRFEITKDSLLIQGEGKYKIINFSNNKLTIRREIKYISFETMDIDTLRSKHIMTYFLTKELNK